jgi:hypothetical protein
MYRISYHANTDSDGVLIFSYNYNTNNIFDGVVDSSASVNSSLKWYTPAIPNRNMIGLKRLTDYPTYTKAQVIAEAKRQYELQFGGGLWVAGHQVWTTEYPNIYNLVYQSTGYTHIQMTYGGNRLYRFNTAPVQASTGNSPDPAMVAVGYTMTEM